MCHVNSALSGLWQPAYRPPQATFARYRLSALGPHQIQTSIAWRGTREDRFRTHRNDNSEAPTWVHLGPFSARRLKTLKTSRVWAAGGARAHGRLTGDVLGGLPPENPEAFRAISWKGKERKWVAFGVVVKDGRDWMTAGKNVGMWHRGV